MLEMVRLGELLAAGGDRLKHAGVPEPRRQALRIWAELNRARPADALLQSDLELDSEAVRQFENAIHRRASGEPLPHVTGWTGFRQLVLRIDRRALIPRPETEGLVDLVLDRVRTGRVADVGTGCGCIALSLAVEGEYTDVVAVDRSPEALALARLNRKLVGAEITLVQADLCSTLRTDSLDALVSNPPYLTEAEYAGLDPSVRDWEPVLALVSGEDGLDTTTLLIDDARRVLRPGGWLVLEVDCARAHTVARLAGTRGWEDVTTHTDLFGRERYLLARRSNTR
jgi:release factor glutamine methyltransferase